MDNPDKKSPTLVSRMLRAFLGSIPGLALGLVCFFVLGYGVVASLVVGVLGVVIGAALAQPDVSTGNVLKGTAGVIAAHNAPGFLKQRIMDAAFNDSDQPQQPPSGQPGTLPNLPQKPGPAEPKASADGGRDSGSS